MADADRAPAEICVICRKADYDAAPRVHVHDRLSKFCQAAHLTTCRHMCIAICSVLIIKAPVRLSTCGDL